MVEEFEDSDGDGTARNARGRDTFVVRIWASDGSDAMRGHVQHVHSRKRAYFATPQRLMSFIQDHLQDTRQGQCRN